MSGGGAEQGVTTDVLVRRAENKVLGGVASGLAAWSGRDVLWFRAAFVVGAYALGLGVVVYAALLALPSQPRPTGPDARLSGRAVVGTALALVGTTAMIIALVISDGATPTLVVLMLASLVALGLPALRLLIRALRDIDTSEGRVFGRGVVGVGFALLTIGFGLMMVVGLAATAQPIV